MLSVEAIRQRQGRRRNGRQGVFVGWPLIAEKTEEKDSQVEQIWFSKIQEVPVDLTLQQLMELVQREVCNCGETLQ